MGQAYGKPKGVGGRGTPQRLQPRDLEEATHVLFVHLERGVQLPMTNLAGEWNPYVRLCLDPQRSDDKKMQRQESSLKFRTLSPTWQPAERFEFIVTEKSTARLLLQVGDRNLGRRDSRVCAAVLRLGQLQVGEEENHQLQLYRASDGSKCSSSSFVQVRALLLPRDSAFDTVHDVVWEYSRMDKRTGLAGGDLRGSDAGKYSDEAGRFFSHNFQGVSPRIPKGYVVHSTWAIRCAWQYALAPTSQRWLDEHFGRAKACRRRWVRELRRCGESDDGELHFVERPPPPPPVTPEAACFCLPVATAR
ncbi:hypothetical protein M885DRAFT_525786 [Pelagophyceae sp. CCMP2097]|nr:hypothetical protein M885DRAFT_525786 [Pelagophyceae sp. CCMP2097]|mmetsp:Transcript_9803/g.32299  ORF Transcript_9803/g.32299 Transcript_9803/m.32299 type:complete len:305 (-) Transcript_9803:34-948(-)